MSDFAAHRDRLQKHLEEYLDPDEFRIKLDQDETGAFFRVLLATSLPPGSIPDRVGAITVRGMVVPWPKQEQGTPQLPESTLELAVEVLTESPLLKSCLQALSFSGNMAALRFSKGLNDCSTAKIISMLFVLQHYGLATEPSERGWWMPTKQGREALEQLQRQNVTNV